MVEAFCCYNSLNYVNSDWGCSFLKCRDNQQVSRENKRWSRTCMSFLLQELQLWSLSPNRCLFKGLCTSYFYFLYDHVFIVQVLILWNNLAVVSFDKSNDYPSCNTPSWCENNLVVRITGLLQTNWWKDKTGGFTLFAFQHSAPPQAYSKGAKIWARCWSKHPWYYFVRSNNFKFACGWWHRMFNAVFGPPLFSGVRLTEEDVTKSLIDDDDRVYWYGPPT